MHSRSVTVFHPPDAAENAPARAIRADVPVASDEDTVYKSVEHFAEMLAEGATTDCDATVDSLPLRAVVNLHNAEGMRDLAQVAEMTAKIAAGKEIYHDNGLPNVKVAQLDDGTRVLFDGHHTMLAYMCCGRESLAEIPHLAVTADDGSLGPRDMLAFFGEHAADMRPEDWSRLVINWQGQPDWQVSARVQHDMGELFDALRDQLPEAQA